MTISSQVYLQKNETSDGLTNFATQAENGKVKCQYSLTSLKEQPRHLFASDADDKHETGSVCCEATQTQRSHLRLVKPVLLDSTTLLQYVPNI